MDKNELLTATGVVMTFAAAGLAVRRGDARTGAAFAAIGLTCGVILARRYSRSRAR
ncbi:MAG: hypothetical protein QM809_02655 [Gordonia sp. (in: high G+C Gram-positive bacteria)]|uniref:hypothetical protein n=1 Tax=Gordonia sp. (in: high G+C Gram-positive bacteria) TaxID=84139 RepID=UPI0039E2CFA1